MAVDTDGNIYVSGSCAAAQSMFGGIAFPAPFEYNTYLAKYDSFGNAQWVNFVEDITCPSPAIIIDNEGRLLWTSDVFSMKSQHSKNQASPEWVFGFHLSALNGDGDIIWQYTVPYVLTGDVKLARNKPLQLMPDNSISIAGATRGIIDWGNGVVSSKDCFDFEALVLNISADGQAMWAITGGGPGHDMTKALDVDDAGNLYVVGVGNGTIQFDTCTYTGDSFYYPFLVKINAGLNTGIDSDNLPVRFIAYPNPANDYLIIESASENNISAILLNLNGQEIMRHTFHNQDAKVDVSSLSPGVYLLQIISNNAVESQKIIIH